jgi:hypothetical protein
MPHLKKRKKNKKTEKHGHEKPLRLVLPDIYALLCLNLLSAHKMWGRNLK